jgi:hypothetical protein
MPTPNFLLDAKLSQAVYQSNNRGDTPVIEGWRPIQLELTKPTVATFGAQLYEKNGQYKLVFRGTENNIPDWLINVKYGLNNCETTGSGLPFPKIM